MGCVGSVCGTERKQVGGRQEKKIIKNIFIGSGVKELGGPSL